LLDRLEEAISTGWKIPFTSRVAVNEQELVELSDSIRSAVPSELREAQKVMHDRAAFIAEAEEEAQQLVEAAQRRADDLIAEQAVMRTAEIRAQSVMEQAQQRAEDVKTEADAYVLDSLRRMETQLTQTLATVRNGITTLGGAAIDREENRAS